MMSDPKILWCHIPSANNIGDQVCCPIDYVELPGWRFDLTRRPPNEKFDLIIIGGGGLLNEFLGKRILSVVNRGRENNRHLKVIVWGAGANEHDTRSMIYPAFLETFD